MRKKEKNKPSETARKLKGENTCMYMMCKKNRNLYYFKQTESRKEERERVKQKTKPTTRNR